MAFSFYPNIFYYRHYLSGNDIDTIRRIKSIEYHIDFHEFHFGYDICIYVSSDTKDKYNNLFSDPYFNRFKMIVCTRNSSVVDSIDLRKMLMNGDKKAYEYIPEKIIPILEEDNVYKSISFNDSDNEETLEIVI